MYCIESWVPATPNKYGYIARVTTTHIWFQNGDLAGAYLAEVRAKFAHLKTPPAVEVAAYADKPGCTNGGWYPLDVLNTKLVGPVASGDRWHNG